MPSLFKGFPRGGFQFFEELSNNQDRDWFAENKQRYVELWQEPMQALVDTLTMQLSRTFPSLNEAPSKVMRIYRDTRFSKDKTPYKTHIAAMLPIGNPPGEGGGLYVHLGHDELIVAAGRWMMEPADLTRFRAGIADDDSGEAFAKDVKKLEKKGFGLHSFESLKRVPAPYPQDHPRAELLKRKGLSFEFPKFKKSLVAGPEFMTYIVKNAKVVAPVLQQMDRFVSGGR